MINKKDLFIASLIGGAIGDALGYPVEFSKMDAITRDYGKDGIIDLNKDINTGLAPVTDDTQMTLFTADGLIWAMPKKNKNVIDYLHKSYLRWYHTQTKTVLHEKNENILNRQSHEDTKSILDYKELYKRRSPGISCLTALNSFLKGTVENPVNDSKGCGAVVRVAPIGLFFHEDIDKAYNIAVESAAITHGHPTGQIAAGAFAVIIANLVNGLSIKESVYSALNKLKDIDVNQETTNAILKALKHIEENTSPQAAIRDIGEGWVAEETLALAIYCALKETDFKKALILAVNHNGDSDSVGSICGNILGAHYGTKAIPKDWESKLQLRYLITTKSIELYETMIKIK